MLRFWLSVARSRLPRSRDNQLVGWLAFLVLLGGIDLLLARYAGQHWGATGLVVLFANDLLVVMLVVCLGGLGDRVRELRAERARKLKHHARHSVPDRT